MAIEIVDFPIKNWWIFPWQNVKEHQRVVQIVGALLPESLHEEILDDPGTLMEISKKNTDSRMT